MKKGDLAYALRLLASGQGIVDVWKEAGYSSRKELADELFALAENLEKKGVKKSFRVIVYTDGASAGNPGEAGCGAIVTDEKGEVLLEDYAYLGKTTNNVAEYHGAILGLRRAQELGATDVELRLDSSLLANQIKGGYKVKSRRLAGLYQDLMRIAKQFESLEVTLIKSSENSQADRLANLAISTRKRGEPGAG